MGEGTRTPDIQIHSLTAANPKPVVPQGICGDAPAVVAQRLPNDPDLARLVAAWPSLPEPIRRAVLALIDSAQPRNHEATKCQP